MLSVIKECGENSLQVQTKPKQCGTEIVLSFCKRLYIGNKSSSIRQAGNSAEKIAAARILYEKALSSAT